MRRRLGTIAKGTAGLLSGLAVLSALAYGALVLGGYRPVVVYSGSMEPELGVGSVALVKSVPSASVEVGDVITFADPYQPGRLVTHRVAKAVCHRRNPLLGRGPDPVRGRRVLLPFAGIACAALLAVSGSARMSAAAFTSNLTITGNGVTVDRLSNHFEVTPGPPASGDVDSLDVDLGLVASPGAITGVFTVENVSAQTRTATLSLQGPAQVASVVFEASGTASVTLAPGASSSVAVTISPSVAGRGTGTFRLALGGSSWLYRDYTLSLDAAPAAPGSLNAAAQAGGKAALALAPSATTTNLAGYDVYRSAGGPYTKLNGSPIAGTTFTDTTGAEGTAYTYKVRAVSSGAVALVSTDSPLASATPDATAPILPSAVQLVNGGGQGSQYVNLANRASVSISVTLPATSVASDVVTVTLRNGAQSVSKTAP